MSAQDVLSHHLAAFGKGDVDEVLQDYTEDSILIIPEATLRGREAIRGAFTGFFSGLFRPGTYTFSLDRSEIVGDVAYIVWHSANAGANVTLGTDTFLVHDGKIAVQTFAGRVEAT